MPTEVTILCRAWCNFHVSARFFPQCIFLGAGHQACECPSMKHCTPFPLSSGFWFNTMFHYKLKLPYLGTGAKKPNLHYLKRLKFGGWDLVAVSFLESLLSRHLSYNLMFLKIQLSSWILSPLGSSNPQRATTQTFFQEVQSCYPLKPNKSITRNAAGWPFCY